MRKIDTDRELRRLESLAEWLDNRFRIPGTQIRFGLDSLFGILPGVGDGLMLVPSVYVILRARRLGAPISLILRMLINVLLDFVVGLVPVLGDVFDIFFRANTSNVDLLRDYLSR
ncbi:MAG: DUF4112 domain-containing protein [Minwuia sp.]|nr:DUF4112 domain-containing protein [Minwuia sp.]